MAAAFGGRPGQPRGADGVESGAYDRVVRIVSWVFILATSMIVAVTGLWPETQTAILALLAAAGVFVLVVHDLLPAGALGHREVHPRGSVAITFATLLVVLTGREDSPFFFTFPLIVGGAALVVTPAGDVRARGRRERRLHHRDRPARVRRRARRRRSPSSGST